MCPPTARYRAVAIAGSARRRLGTREFLPCGHMLACSPCAQEHLRRSNTCPICRRRVVAVAPTPAERANTYVPSEEGLLPTQHAASAAPAAALAALSLGVTAINVAPDGTVLEPAFGAFDVVVAPGEDVQAAVDACPAGGCVLLLPGIPDGPLVLGEHGPLPGPDASDDDESEEGDGAGGIDPRPPPGTAGVVGAAGGALPSADKEVHVFGRGLATLEAERRGTLVESEAAIVTLDGLILRHHMGHTHHNCVRIKRGRLRMQATSRAPRAMSSALSSRAAPTRC